MVNQSSAAPTPCKNCAADLHGKYCASCGQQVYHDKDKTLPALVRDAWHFMTNFDGKIFKTLKTIYTKPGQLALDYSAGIRQRYYKPISFYLLIVLIYLLFPLMSGMNMEMKFYKGTPIMGRYMGAQIEALCTVQGISEAALAEQFNAKSRNIAKFLLLLLIPLSLPLLYLLYFRRRAYLFDRLILLAEINTFYLLTYFLIAPLLLLPFMYIFKVTLSDRIIVPFMVVTFIGYCTAVFRKVFGEAWWRSLLKGSLFCLLFLLVVVNVYRLIVFEVTLALL